MSKRKNGEGSWGKKTINGIKYFYFRDVSGKYTYGKTQKALKEKLAKKAKELNLDEAKITFGDYILDWLQTSKKKSLGSQTYDGYENIINSMIINYSRYDLANKQMSQLSSSIFQKYINALADDYAKASIKKIWAVIKQCVEYAEVKGEIVLNTTKLVNLPSEANVKNKKKEVPFLSKEQMEIFYNTAMSKTPNGFPVFGNNAYALILIMYTGMRVSECVALKWKNVDLKNKRIFIRESAAVVKDRTDSENKYRSIDKETKTESSVRTIPLTVRAIDAINYFSNFCKNHNDNDYVCVNRNRGKLDARAVNRSVDRIIQKSGMEFNDKFTTHSLRHSYGSVLLNEGVEIKTVSELLGHKNISTTYNIYIGILEKDKSSAVEGVFNQ